MPVEIPIRSHFAITPVTGSAAVKHVADRSSSEASAYEWLELRNLPDFPQTSACLRSVLSAAGRKLSLQREIDRPINAANVEVQADECELIDGSRSDQSIGIAFGIGVLIGVLINRR